MVSTVERGRREYAARSWVACCGTLTAADAEEPLGPDDLVLLSIAAFMAGRDELSVATLVRAHEGFLAEGAWEPAARTAFWLAFQQLNAGDIVRGSAWGSRANDLAAERDLHGAVPAYLDGMQAHLLLMQGRAEDALAQATRVARAGRREHDPDLETLSLLTCGHALATLGRPAEALERLDQAILLVDEGRLSPPVAGAAYCSVILACLRLSEVRRAGAWTDALTGWCDAQSGLVPYRGQCLVHRSQLMTLRGAWPEAMAEAREACRRLTGPTLGDGYYQLGELHRLLGEFDQAEDAYRRANSAGRRPEPGLARLRLAQGRVDAALAAVRRLYAEPGRDDRAEVLAVYVDTMLAAARVGDASAAAEELRGLAEQAGLPLPQARAYDATGAVLLASGRPADSLAALRRACETWQELDLPYDAARTRARIARALSELGDREAARLELDAARDALERLGARPDLKALGGAHDLGGPLTPREVDVVRLVARGLSNRAVADELVLSEKTVARHLANVYAKLGLSSRAAATAYAYDQGLV